MGIFLVFDKFAHVFLVLLFHLLYQLPFESWFFLDEEMACATNFSLKIVFILTLIRNIQNGGYYNSFVENNLVHYTHSFCSV